MPASESTTPRPAAAHATRMLEFLHALGGLNDPALIEKARWCLLDSLGCGLLGAMQPWGRIVGSEAMAEASQGPCTVLGQSTTVAPSQAALCNGTAMHGFELDDLLSAALIHPGAVIVPAALATAEAVDASGMQLLRGIVAGYEATERISLALGTDPSNRGFHKTSVVGPVAAAIAAGVIMGLEFRQLQWAVGLACSCSSGIKNFAAGGGAGMIKRLHAGRAAEAGTKMAILAHRGFTAPLGALDGKFGLLQAFSGDTARAERLDEGLGTHWALTDVWVKAYPICGWIQGVVQLLLALRAQHGFDPASVEHITVATSSFAVKYNGNTEIEDTMDAQYSIPYCAAVALTGDPLDPKEYAPERIRSPQRQAISRKVELTADPLADKVYPRHFSCRVSLRLTDGRTMTARTLDAHGTPEDPSTPPERIQKFSRLAQLSTLDIDAAAVISSVEKLASGISSRELTASLRLQA
ncbi:MmgE/PrpD family protein [Candidimonas nitroreducens]|uniref:MmgE/PrpD family protein n=2 Tax=Candidimonas nitroreducens TaxID=683354 RepID=A0A225MGB9_9BURK|nr:MmgE/PrpD family protein [Candidimonas nitroreducens]